MEREDDMRKYLTLILSLLALMCALCVSALAEEPEPEQAAGKLYIETVDEIDISEARRLAEAQSTQSSVNTEDWEAAKRTLKQGIQEMQDDINVSRYAIPIESIKELYLEVAYETRTCFTQKPAIYVAIAILQAKRLHGRFLHVIRQMEAMRGTS